MKKITLAGLTLLALSTLAPAHAEEKRYVSDELSTWVRSGPGDQFRLLGKLNAGEEVQLLQTNNDTHYGQIRDSEGRTTWIPLSQLSANPSLRTRVPQLEQQVKDLTAKLDNIDNSWNQRTAETHKLKPQPTVAQQTARAANLQLDDKQRTIIKQWFMYGGGVLGVGLLLGLLLPHMLPRRKKSDRWMN